MAGVGTFCHDVKNGTDGNEFLTVEIWKTHYADNINQYHIFLLLEK